MPRRKRGHKAKPAVEYGSDDERKYQNEDVPDPTSREYYYDEVDEFHAHKDKVLLDQGVQEDVIDSDEEEEVLPVVPYNELLSDDDDEEIRQYRRQLQRFKQSHIKDKMGSDLEDSDEGLPDNRAWGQKRSRYYGGDVVDNRIYLSGSEDEEGQAALEEKEALALQKRMAEELEDQDFGLEILKPVKKTVGNKNQEKIVKDLSTLSKREKIELLKKESPELLTLIEDFRKKMTEIQDVLQPLFKLVHDGKVQGEAANYVKVKFHLHLNYCINISFYLMLKAKHVPAHNHPVIKRLVQYRNLMKQLEPVDEKLQSEVEDILDRLKKGENVNFTPAVDVELEKKQKKKVTNSASSKKPNKRRLKNIVSDDSDTEDDQMTKQKSQKKKPKDGRYETKAEKHALAYYKMIKGGDPAASNFNKEEEIGDIARENDTGNIAQEEEEADGKRAITYQIAKNKGLTAHKKKELRNPRVKHRMKYRKAKIRRRGQVREVKSEIQPYGGELFGIRAGVKRSIKLKR